MELIDTDKLLAYLKTRQFQFTNSEKLEELYLESDTYNPFDTSFEGQIKGNNDLLITIDKENNQYKIRVGKDSGWIGGLSYTNNEEVFTIEILNTVSLINGFKNNLNNQLYTLCSLYSSNSIKDKIMVGTLKEIDKYCLNLSYQKENAHESYKGTFKEFFYYNYFLKQYDKKLLKVFAL